jgi:hypothetical protein
MFSVWCEERCYKQDIWTNELVWDSRQCVNMSTEAEGVVAIRHQATTGENISTSEDLLRAVVNCRKCELVIAL